MPHVYIPLLYIDPSSGSLVIQAAIAAIIVVPFFLRTQIRRAVDRVRGRPASAVEAGSAASTAAADAAPETAPILPEPPIHP